MQEMSFHFKIGIGKEREANAKQFIEFHIEDDTCEPSGALEDAERKVRRLISFSGALIQLLADKGVLSAEEIKKLAREI